MYRYFVTLSQDARGGGRGGGRRGRVIRIIMRPDDDRIEAASSSGSRGCVRGQQRERKGSSDDYEERGRGGPKSDERSTETIKFQSLSNSAHILRMYSENGVAAQIKPSPMLPRSTKNGQRKELRSGRLLCEGNSKPEQPPLCPVQQ